MINKVYYFMADLFNSIFCYFYIHRYIHEFAKVWRKKSIICFRFSGVFYSFISDMHWFTNKYFVLLCLRTVLLMTTICLYCIRVNIKVLIRLCYYSYVAYVLPIEQVQNIMQFISFYVSIVSSTPHTREKYNINS